MDFEYCTIRLILIKYVLENANKNKKEKKREENKIEKILETGLPQ